MTTTVFTDTVTPIISSWLNDVDTAAYKAIGTGTVVPTNATDVRTNLAVETITTNRAAFSASSGAALVGYLPAGTGAVATTVQAKLRESVSVLDFGADSTGAVDATTAFTNANTASKCLILPPGTYKLTNWQPTNGTVLRGAGYTNTFITQGAAGSPAFFINNGNVSWQGLEFSGFTLNGATSPTVAAFQITPGASGAVWRSKFDFVCENTYQAFNITSVGTNFFDNEVNIRSEGTITTAIYIQSGTYNRYKLFLTQCGNSIALTHGGVDDTFYIVSDGQINSSGINTTFINPSVEDLYGTALAAGEAVISLTNGVNQVLINPTVILPTNASVAKCTYAFKPSIGAVFQNPYVTSLGSTKLANPFAANAGFTWSIQGGRSDCTNKIETIYNDSDNVHCLRYVTMLGDVSQYTAQTQTHGGKVTQYLAPTVPFNATINGNTDVMIVEPSGTIANNTFFILTGIVDGRVITVTTTQILTAITWAAASGTTTLLPASMAANTRISFVYNLAQNKFYPV